MEHQVEKPPINLPKIKADTNTRLAQRATDGSGKASRFASALACGAVMLINTCLFSFCISTIGGNR